MHSLAAARIRSIAAILVGIAGLWAFAEAGTLIARAIHLAIPGSVVGMLGLWAALELGIVRMRWFDRGGLFLLSWLGLLFVPAGVGFVRFAHAGTRWLELGAIVAVGLIVGLAVTGRVVQRGLGSEPREPAGVGPGTGEPDA